MSHVPPEPNPYAPPEAPIAAGPVAATPELAEAEAMRRTYLGHEASVKSIGSLAILGAILGGAGSVLLLVGVAPGGAGQGAFRVALIFVYLALGIGLTRLQVWARWTAVVLLGLALCSIVLGAFVLVFAGAIASDQIGFLVIGYAIAGLIVGYMLYLLLASKAGVVFSREYKEVIAATPHIKYRSGGLVKGCLVVFAILVLLSIVGGVVSTFLRKG